jgi:hypothetical protein
MFSRRLRVTFKLFVFHSEPKWYTGGNVANATNVVNFSIGTILQLEVTIARKMLPSSPRGMKGMRNLLNKGLFI